MSLPILRGRTVDLYCGSFDDIEAEGRGVEVVCARLGVKTPIEWPPANNDEATRSYFKTGLLLHPGSEAWWYYYVVAREPEGDVLAGLAGFTGPPQAGVVEVGYAILPSFQGRGYATEAVGLLISAAFTCGVEAVAAQTMPENLASQRVMIKSGMVFHSETRDPDSEPETTQGQGHDRLWRYEARQT